jgi:uncharacterized membrane protein YhaH (DUF805 family)
MDFPQAIKSGFRNYVRFGGRASRSEYWYWTLFAVLVGFVGNIIDAQLDTKTVGLVFDLLLFLPNFAMGSRRLHDIDRTFWWSLLVFTIIGVLVLVYWASLPGAVGPNRFGPDPLKNENFR